MNADFLRYRGLLAAAVGAGVVLGAAGIFLYHQLYAEKRRMLLQRDLARLDMTVSEMRSELDALRRAARNRRPAVRRSNTKSASTADSEVDADIDLYSAIGTDDDDEFFDFSDDDDGDLMVSSVNLLDVSETETDPDLLKLLEDVDRLLKGTAEEKSLAYNMLLEYEDKYSDHVSILWRLAKANHTMATIYGAEGDNEKKKEYVFQGFQYAQRALELDESNAEAHKWFAVTVGSRGEFLGTKEKIEDGYVFKNHVDKALQLRPDDPSLHHLLGRFKYEVATLSWLERKVAETLFAELPNATYSEAIEDFMKAESLSPSPWKENRLLIAKCHINQGNYCEGVSWLDKTIQVPVVSPDDESAEREAQDLLQKYCGYRK